MLGGVVLSASIQPRSIHSYSFKFIPSPSNSSQFLPIHPKSFQFIPIHSNWFQFHSNYECELNALRNKNKSPGFQSSWFQIPFTLGATQPIVHAVRSADKIGPRLKMISPPWRCVSIGSSNTSLINQGTCRTMPILSGLWWWQKVYYACISNGSLVLGAPWCVSSLSFHIIPIHSRVLKIIQNIPSRSMSIQSISYNIKSIQTTSLQPGRLETGFH